MHKKGFMFFDNLDKFGGSVAVYDSGSGVNVTYAELEGLVSTRVKQLGDKRRLVFVEAHNSLQSVVDYIACLRGRHVVYLLDNLKSEKVESLIRLYNPNILINSDGDIQRINDEVIELHQDLALLLSTSGSTGSPKFVKLSQKNIQSNAESICEYLELTESDSALSHLKLHYSYGISILNSHLQVGASVILTSHTVIDDGFWAVFNQYKATSFAGVPYTFETLLHNDFTAKDYPSLRYVTQAGGKLESGLVKQFSGMLSKYEVKFFVMYGQTEAAPRISYLPPDLVEEFPGVIGKSIPGGELYIIDDNGDKITEEDRAGELVYSGPNVMMGYAIDAMGLSVDETPDRLLTGDIACRTKFDLFYMVGRTSRFVKPFGVRVNLDEVQSYIKLSHPQSAVTGDDKIIIIALLKSNEVNADNITSDLSNKYALPKAMFSIVFYDDLPLLSSGKYDYKTILSGAGVSVPAKPSIFSLIINKVADILELNDNEWSTVLVLYQTILSSSNVTKDDSFSELESDSLSFVSLSIELENMLGADLPQGWVNQSIECLDSIYSKVKYG